METTEFRIRPYAKSELACLYFPTSPTTAAALRNLYNLMHRCTPLMDELRQAGYSDRQKILLARHVRLIVKYLEEP